MKYLIIFFASLMVFGSCNSKKESHEHPHDSSTVQASADTMKKSIPMEEHAMIGSAHVTILYTSPAVRGRQIWGGLVTYDQVWVTGAHKATSFEINKDFSINGKIISAGKYALFTIPGKDEWTFIINKNWDQHLADKYNPQEDVLRIQVKPTTEEVNQERLKYTITPTSDKEATLTIAWEKIKLTIPFTIQ